MKKAFFIVSHQYLIVKFFVCFCKIFVWSTKNQIFPIQRYTQNLVVCCQFVIQTGNIFLKNLHLMINNLNENRAYSIRQKDECKKYKNIDDCQVPRSNLLHTYFNKESKNKVEFLFMEEHSSHICLPWICGYHVD